MQPSIHTISIKYIYYYFNVVCWKATSVLTQLVSIEVAIEVLDRIALFPMKSSGQAETQYSLAFWAGEAENQNLSDFNMKKKTKHK